MRRRTSSGCAIAAEAECCVPEGRRDEFPPRTKTASERRANDERTITSSHTTGLCIVVRAPSPRTTLYRAARCDLTLTVVVPVRPPTTILLPRFVTSPQDKRSTPELVRLLSRGTQLLAATPDPLDGPELPAPHGRNDAPQGRSS